MWLCYVFLRDVVVLWVFKECGYDILFKGCGYVLGI